MDRDSILRAAAQAAEQMEGRPSINPYPVPTAVQLAPSRDSSGNKFVMITFTTPIGQNVFFLDPESADKIGDGLKETARFARTGLELAR